MKQARIDEIAANWVFCLAYQDGLTVEAAARQWISESGGACVRVSGAPANPLDPLSMAQQRLDEFVAGIGCGVEVSQPGPCAARPAKKYLQ